MSSLTPSTSASTNWGLELSRPDPQRTKLTMSVPEAGALIGLARNSAYAAAKRGDIPTLTIGRRLLVPTARFLAMLGIPAVGEDDESVLAR